MRFSFFVNKATSDGETYPLSTSIHIQVSIKNPMDLASPLTAFRSSGFHSPNPYLRQGAMSDKDPP